MYIATVNFIVGRNRSPRRNTIDPPHVTQVSSQTYIKYTSIIIEANKTQPQW